MVQRNELLLQVQDLQASSQVADAAMPVRTQEVASSSSSGVLQQQLSEVKGQLVQLRVELGESR